MGINKAALLHTYLLFSLILGEVFEPFGCPSSPPLFLAKVKETIKQNGTQESVTVPVPTVKQDYRYRVWLALATQ